MTFSFLDFILFAGISQGVFLSSSLKLTHNRNKKANNILALAIAFAVLMLLGRLLVFRLSGIWVGWLAVVVDTTIFLFGPLLFLYSKRLLFEPQQQDKKFLKHYILALGHFLYATIIITISILEGKHLGEFPILRLTGFIVETLGLLSFMLYTIKAIVLIHKHKVANTYSLSYLLAIRRFLKVIVGVLVVFTTLWCISYVSGYFFRVRIPYLNYTSLWVSIPLFIYVIGYYSLRQPEIFKMPNIPTVKKEKARLKPEEIKQLQKRLHYFMNEEQIYQESDLSLNTLAERLNTSSNNLSWLLNQIYQKSFYDYVNGQRVQDVLNCIDLKMHEDQTILSLAFDAGFNSKSTFNKTFKNVTGLTPSAYIKSKKVA